MVGYTWSPSYPDSSLSHLVASEVSYQHLTPRNTGKTQLDAWKDPWIHIQKDLDCITNSLKPLGNSFNHIIRKLLVYAN